MSDLPSPDGFKGYKATLQPKQYSNGITDSIPLEQVAQEFNMFEPISDKHTNHLQELFPQWMYDNAHQADGDYFCYLVRFNNTYNSLVAAVVENKMYEVGIVSYKHRMKNGIKWHSRAGTHPNNTVMYRVYADNEPTIVVEGIRDFLAGILLGFNVIGIPTASYKGSINVRKDDEVIFLIEDKPAYEVMIRLGKEISSVTNKITYSMADDAKLDLSDICFKCGSAKEVKNAIYSTKRS